MKKLILALGVLSTLAAPALAGRLDIEAPVLQANAQSAAPTGLDYSGTRSIRDGAPSPLPRPTRLAASRAASSAPTAADRFAPDLLAERRPPTAGQETLKRK